MLKKLFLIIFGTLSLSIMSHGKTIMTESPHVNVADTVIINPFPDIDPGGRPRSPALVPISAIYESMLSTVFLTFTSNLGEIEVEVMNTTNGYYDSGSIQTWPLYAIIPISGGPGHYIILFTLPSGQQYKGEFDI